MLEKWVKGAQSGDEQAWALLYKQYYPVLYPYALSICRDPFVAKDALQETFISACLKLGQLKDPAQFGYWLRTILMRNCYKSVNREQQNRAVVSGSSIKDTLWEDRINEKIDIIYRQGLLYTALNRLSDTLLSAVILRYFTDFQSYEEISEILAIPPGTVRSRLNQAKINLEEHWRQCEEPDTDIVREAKYWDQFYNSVFAGMHHHDEAKGIFLDHLRKDVSISFPGIDVSNGSWLIDREITRDRDAGSWFNPVNIYSCGNISVVETHFHNPPENPAHCPERGVCVLYRDLSKVTRLNLHLSSRKK